MTADISSADPVISRYSALARAALAGSAITDCDPDVFAGRCFGAAAYSDASDVRQADVRQADVRQADVRQADVPEEALRASLGCGNPLAVASLQPGEIVLDLGSGGGLDVLLSARRVGPDGTAYGVDASPDMLTLARRNAVRARIANAIFLHGRIEDIPLPDGHVDVVISNCVINLSGDKARVLTEAFRVLKPGGRLGISDVIADEGVDPRQLAEAEHRVGCGGTLNEPRYRDLLHAAGFTGIRIARTTNNGGGLHSAIVQAGKPSACCR